MNEDDVARVSTPAMLLMVTGILLLMVDLFNAFFSLFAILSPIFQIVATGLQVANGADNTEIAAGVFQVVLASILGVLKVVCAILGIGASAATIVASQRLLQFRTRNIVSLGAILAAIQPILWVVTGCFTSFSGR